MDHDKQHELTRVEFSTENQVFKESHDQFYASEKSDLDNQGAFSTTYRHELQGPPQNDGIQR